MFFDDTLYDLIARGFILTAVGILYVIFLTRIVGLRRQRHRAGRDGPRDRLAGVHAGGCGHVRPVRGAVPDRESP